MGPGAVGPGARLCLRAAPRGPAAAARPALNCTRKRTEGGREEADKAKGHGPNLSKQQPGWCWAPGQGWGCSRAGKGPKWPRGEPKLGLATCPSPCRARAAPCRAGWVPWGAQELRRAPFSPHLLYPQPLSPTAPSPWGQTVTSSVSPCCCTSPCSGRASHPFCPKPRHEPPREDPSPSPDPSHLPPPARTPKPGAGAGVRVGFGGAGGGAMLPPRPRLRRR